LRLAVVAVVALLLSFAMVTASVQRIDATSTPSGSCPANGPFTVSTAVRWANLSCHHVGNVFVTGSGSLTMVNSSLVVDGNGTSSLLLVNQTATLALVASSVSFSNGVGMMEALQDASVQLTRGSSLADASVIMANAAVFEANESSTVTPISFVAHDMSTVVLNSSTLAVQTIAPVLNKTITTTSSATTTTTVTSTTTSTTTFPIPPVAVGKLSVGGSKLLLFNSLVSLAYTKNVSLSAFKTLILGSKVQSDGALQIQVGNATSATSVTVIGDASLISGSSASTVLDLYGSRSLSVVDSSITADVASQAATPVATLYLEGGQVTVTGSTLISTSREAYGFPPNSFSDLNITAAGNLAVAGSRLLAGQDQESGIAHSSALGLSAAGNTTVSDSSLQSLSFSQALTLGATAINYPNYLTISRSSLVMLNNTGSVALRSGRVVLLENSVINTPSSSFKTLAYQLDAYNSRIQASNVGSTLVFGNGVTYGNFYNVTISGCTSPIGPSCLTAQHSGSYSVYGIMGVSVAFKSPASQAAGANVTLMDRSTGAIDYTLLTGPGGTVTMPVLINQVSGVPTKSGSPSTLARPSYLVQASLNGQVSPQELVTTNSTFHATLEISKPTDMTTVAVAGESPLDLVSTYNLTNETYPISPASYYAVGPYLASEFVPQLTIVSNALPLGFRSTPGNSQMTFSTMGLLGGTDYFVLIYPNNMTTTPVSVIVDGAAVQATTTSSSTTEYTVFAIPAGFHSVVLSYTAPNGFFSQIVYPYVYPKLTTIVLVVVLALVALLLIVLFVRRRELSSSAPASPSAAVP